MSPINPECALDLGPEAIGCAAGISGVIFQCRKLAAAPINWDHAREFEGAELCVKRVDDVPVTIPWDRICDELGGDLLSIVGSAPA